MVSSKSCSEASCLRASDDLTWMIQKWIYRIKTISNKLARVIINIFRKMGRRNDAVLIEKIIPKFLLIKRMG
jgi:hypothetical protein